MGITRRIVESVKRGSFRSDIAGRIDTWRHDHRRLADRAEHAGGTRSSARINRYASSLSSATRYLEIGVEHGYTLEAVKLKTRIGVDPHPLFSLKSLPAGLIVRPITSDQYFDELGDEVRFDVAFLDGLHTYQQTYRDLINALHHLDQHGVIIIDDVVPSDEISSMPDLEASIREQVNRSASDFRWHGDVFRIIPLLRDHHPELKFRTVVGGGNEQTVVWRVSEDHESVPVDEATLAAYSHVTYEETFSDGIPAFFMPGSDEQIVREFEEDRTTPPIG
jgi:hypothetical protein